MTSGLSSEVTGTATGLQFYLLHLPDFAVPNGHSEIGVWVAEGVSGTWHLHEDAVAAGWVVQADGIAIGTTVKVVLVATRVSDGTTLSATQRQATIRTVVPSGNATFALQSYRWSMDDPGAIANVRLGLGNPTDDNANTAASPGDLVVVVNRVASPTLNPVFDTDFGGVIEWVTGLFDEAAPGTVTAVATDNTVGAVVAATPVVTDDPPGSGDRYVLSVDPPQASDPVGSTRDYFVTVTAVSPGAPVNNISITVTVEGANEDLTQVTSTTNAEGVAGPFTIAFPNVGSDVIRASHGVLGEESAAQHTTTPGAPQDSVTVGRPSSVEGSTGGVGLPAYTTNVNTVNVTIRGERITPSGTELAPAGEVLRLVRLNDQGAVVQEYNPGSTTNASGEVVFVDAGSGIPINNGETIRLRSWWDENNNGSAGALEQTWDFTITNIVPPEGSSVLTVTVTPAAASHTVGDTADVIATVTRVTGAVSAPAQGIAVEFQVTGVNSVPSEQHLTDADGNAFFSYVGTEAGTDAVTAQIPAQPGGGDAQTRGSSQQTWQPAVAPTEYTTCVPEAPAYEGQVGDQTEVRLTCTHNGDPYTGPVRVTHVSGVTFTVTIPAVNGLAIYEYSHQDIGDVEFTCYSDADNDGSPDETPTYAEFRSGFVIGTTPSDEAAIVTLTVSPTTNTHVVGDSTSVTAIVTAQRTDDPTTVWTVPNEPVSFEVDGVNGDVPGQVIVTDAQGRAVFTYVGTQPGSDVVTVMTLNNVTAPGGSQQTWEPEVAPVAATRCLPAGAPVSTGEAGTTTVVVLSATNEENGATTSNYTGPVRVTNLATMAVTTIQATDGAAFFSYLNPPDNGQANFECYADGDNDGAADATASYTEFRGAFAIITADTADPPADNAAFSFSNYVESALLNRLLRGDETVFGAGPAVLWMSLHVSAPGDYGAGEASDGLKRRQVQFADAAVDGVIANTNTVVFDTMPADSYTHFGIWDANTPTANFLCWGALSPNVILAEGESLPFSPGDISIELR